MKINIVKRERISSGFLKVDKLDIKLPNEKTISREVLQKKDVVAIMAVTSDGKMYLTKQPRAGIEELESIEIPAGLIECGENPIESAKRELLEETGCVSSEWKELGMFVGDPACCTSKTYIFLALNAEKIQDLNLDADEYLTTFTEDIQTVKQMFTEGRIMDANSIIAFERSKNYIISF